MIDIVREVRELFHSTVGRHHTLSVRNRVMIVVLWLRSYPLKHVEEWTNFQGRWQKLSFAVGAIDGTSMEIYRPGI